MADKRATGTDAGIEGAPHFAVPPEQGEFQAWEEIDTGRFMPRRIRGSCKGRALG